MKKINLFEANAIVGGTCTTCSVEYVRGSLTTCNAVSTCVDKNGQIVSTETTPTDIANCGVVDPS
ncbi:MULTISPECIES: DUF4762 family protein [unclassified Serratia (in: enterobacteria)]|uniref:DUF4762 family protein n=1 Tax=unclassified Serratia (in: enterobacteria) TaxID=2647522 RepID=UPI0009077E5B|nr:MULTISPECIES: DUF4762 family protein [unclassified Serratia (in: enterobacteria)]